MLYGNACPDNFPDVNDYRNPVIAEALKVMGYVNKFNRGIARVQKELVENGNGRAAFTVNKVTVFSVNVTNAKSGIINDSMDVALGSEVDLEKFSFSDKSLKVLMLCAEGAYSKKELLLGIGVTNQTVRGKDYLSILAMRSDADALTEE